MLTYPKWGTWARDPALLKTMVERQVATRDAIAADPSAALDRYDVRYVALRADRPPPAYLAARRLAALPGRPHLADLGTDPGRARDRRAGLRGVQGSRFETRDSRSWSVSRRMRAHEPGARQRRSPDRRPSLALQARVTANRRSTRDRPIGQSRNPVGFRPFCSRISNLASRIDLSRPPLRTGRLALPDVPVRAPLDGPPARAEGDLAPRRPARRGSGHRIDRAPAPGSLTTASYAARRASIRPAWRVRS